MTRDRKILPQRRPGETFKLRFGGQNAAYHVTLGYYDRDMTELGEIFIATHKAGSAAEALARDCAILMSLLLQHGCAVDTMAVALTREQNGAPSTIAGAVADQIIQRQQQTISSNAGKERTTNSDA